MEFAQCDAIRVSHRILGFAAMGAVSLRLPDDISKRLNLLSEQTGRSKSYYMLEAIREHLDDLEDYYLAERRLAEFEASGEAAIPLKDLVADLDLAD